MKIFNIKISNIQYPIFNIQYSIFFTLFLILCFLLLVSAVSAVDVVNLPNPLGTTDIPTLTGRIIKGFLGITGSVALVMFIYGGITWLTSAGNADKIKKGKDIFLWSVVGLFIIFGSYLMVDFVISGLTGKKSDESSQQIDQKALGCCSALVENKQYDQDETTYSQCQDLIKQQGWEGKYSWNWQKGECPK